MKDNRKQKKNFKVSFTKASNLKKDIKENSFKLRMAACDAEDSNRY